MTIRRGKVTVKLTARQVDVLQAFSDITDPHGCECDSHMPDGYPRPGGNGTLGYCPGEIENLDKAFDAIAAAARAKWG